jgi:hypothetical protein
LNEIVPELQLVFFEALKSYQWFNVYLYSTSPLPPGVCPFVAGGGVAGVPMVVAVVVFPFGCGADDDADFPQDNNDKAQKTSDIAAKPLDNLSMTTFSPFPYAR